MIIQNGDCIDLLKQLESNSIDSLVTDPPAGIAFMGKAWDDDKGGRDHWIAWLTDVMKECLRVLKPGAHGLVWALPRTSHWTATALENAGFEIRDVVTHLFGTGFPKSLDISKAIDKAAGAEREVLSKSLHRNHSSSGGILNRSENPRFTTIDKPATDAARQWQGWGTALKPASEHWILVRKPCSEKTVAANVLKHGTGGINVDGCRISTTDNLNGGAYVKDRAARAMSPGGLGLRETKVEYTYQQPTGRFPANLVLSHSEGCTEECDPGCTVRMLDEQSGISPSNVRRSKQGTKSDGATGWLGTEKNPPNDSGGASRFFYCAKASKVDRGEQNKHPTVKSTKLMGYLCKLVTPNAGIILDPFMGSGSTGVAAIASGFQFIGFEKDRESFETAEIRMNA